MKKKILFLGTILIIVCLTTYGFINWEDKVTNIDETPTIAKIETTPIAKPKKEIKVFEGFIYDIGPRFEGVTKDDLLKVTSIESFFDKDHLVNIETLKSVNVILLIDDKKSQFSEISYGSDFNKEQIALLQSLNYSSNFIVRTDYTEVNKETGKLEENHHTHHKTIIPEKQASHFMGKETLKSYFKENCKDVLENVDPEKLLAAKIYFTIAKDGTIKNTYQDRPSGYPEVDERMLKLIKELPGSWKPAENSKGEVVEQELVISFGLMGC